MKYVKYNNINIIHSNSFPDSVYNLLIRRFLKFSPIVTIHGFFSYKHLFIYRILLNKVYKIIAVSNPLKEFLSEKRIYNDKIITIPNGIMDIGYNYKAKVSKTLGVGMVSRFGTSKDQMTICKSLKHLVDKGITNIKLYFWGDSENKDGFKITEYLRLNKLEKYVQLFPETNDVEKAFESLDIYIASSKTESFSIALVEAMSYGLPVIASDIPAHREILQSGKWGYLFKTGDFMDLSDKIIALKDNTNSRTEYSNLSRERSHSYSIKSTIEKLESVYDAC